MAPRERGRRHSGEIQGAVLVTENESAKDLVNLYAALMTVMQGLVSKEGLVNKEPGVPDSEPGSDTAKTPATGAVDPAAGTADLKKGMEGIRDHLRRVGAALGTLGTAVVGGLSYARLNEMFPVPPSIERTVYILAGFGLALSFGGLVYVGGRFYKAQRRILLTEVSEVAGDDWPFGSRIAAAWHVLSDRSPASPLSGAFGAEISSERAQRRRAGHRQADFRRLRASRGS